MEENIASASYDDDTAEHKNDEDFTQAEDYGPLRSWPWTGSNPSRQSSLARRGSVDTKLPRIVTRSFPSNIQSQTGPRASPRELAESSIFSPAPIRRSSVVELERICVGPQRRPCPLPAVAAPSLTLPQPVHLPQIDRATSDPSLTNRRYEMVEGASPFFPIHARPDITASTPRPSQNPQNSLKSILVRSADTQTNRSSILKRRVTFRKTVTVHDLPSYSEDGGIAEDAARSLGVFVKTKLENLKDLEIDQRRSFMKQGTVDDIDSGIVFSVGRRKGNRVDVRNQYTGDLSAQNGVSSTEDGEAEDTGPGHRSEERNGHILPHLDQSSPQQQPSSRKLIEFRVIAARLRRLGGDENNAISNVIKSIHRV